MRDPKRIDYMLDRIRRIWMNNPDMRLMQLLISASCVEKDGDPNKDLFYLEDRDLAIGINKLIRVMRIETAKPIGCLGEIETSP